MKTRIFYIIITILFTAVHTMHSEGYDLSNNTEIILIHTIVKLPDGNSQILNRQVRVPKTAAMNNTFEIESIIKKSDKLELQIISKSYNNITITKLNDDCSGIASEIKLSIDSQQRKTIILEINEFDRVILLFNTEIGEKLIKKLF